MPNIQVRPLTHWLYLLILFWIIGGQSVALRAAQGAENAPAAPLALNPPTNIACIPSAGKIDQVRIDWKDTNDGAADYNVYRKEVGDDDWGDPLATVTDPDSKGRWRYVDANASNSVIYHYQVTAVDAEEETTAGVNETCREPIYLDSDEGNYRIFYRLSECPTFDGKQVCTQNVNVDGKNKHASEVLATSEDYRSEFLDVGFNDPATFNGAKPFPLDFFPCNNGCANSDGVTYPPANFEGPDYDPATGAGEDYEVFIAGHEIFHKVQGAHSGTGPDPFDKWILEGQARIVEDKICIFGSQTQCNIWDTVPKKYYFGDGVQDYLGEPEQPLLEASYRGGLFWLYVTEQFAGVTSEPAYGVDVLLKYWQQNHENAEADNAKDGIDTLNDTLENKLNSSRRFKDIFQDFAVANYAKDYIDNPAPAAFAKYNYRDDEECAACDWGPVKRTVSQPLQPDQPIFGATGMGAWGARYFEVDPSPTVSTVNIEVNPFSESSQLYYHVLAIDNGAIVKQWSDTGSAYNLSVPNNPAYDRIVLIVASMDYAVNFDYGFNLTDGLYILSPNVQFPALAGEQTSPKKFIVQLKVLDEQNKPVAGIDTNEFTVTVGSKVVNPPANPGDEAIVASTYSGNAYWLVIRAPSDPGCTTCALKIDYTSYSDTEADAVIYGPQPDVDNMIIIDRSGSMEGDKFTSAQGAAKLYVDSYSSGDRIGVVSFADTPKSEFSLKGWSNTTRQQAQDAIDDIDAPNGATAIGAALREGMKQLVAQASPNPAWAMVLLSDGADTVEDTKQHIPEFLKEYNARRDDGDQVPVINVVAVGDDADGVALEKVTLAANGQFQWLPENDVLAANADAPNASLFPLNLAEIYRVFAESVTQEQQIYAKQDVISDARTKTHTIKVDGGASQLVIVLEYIYTEFGIPITVKIRRPNNSEVGPPTLNSDNHFFWRIPAPQAGNWKVEVSPIIPGVAAVSADSTATAPAELAASKTDFLLEAALISDLTMQGFLGLPPEERIVGKPMPLLVLLIDVGPITGATVKATVERTGETVMLLDDGQHGDGAANDGFYGGLIKQTQQAGGYSVVIDADGTSQLAGAFVRRARLSFFMAKDGDDDNDKFPNWWENEHPCMDPAKADRAEDYDKDGLINADEFVRQTDPCDPDTDDGGEGDGSEVTRGNDPLMPGDDFTRPPRIKAWPGVGKVTLRLSAPTASPRLAIYRAPSALGPFTLVVSNVISNTYMDTGLTNGVFYCYRATAQGRAVSAPSNVSCATPKRDPHPPHGFVAPNRFLVGPAPRTLMLRLDATDNPYTEEHPAFDGLFLAPGAEQTGVVQMILSERADFAGAEWEPYMESKPWTFTPDASGHDAVYVRFLDGAGNVSETAALSLQIDPNSQPGLAVYLPLISR
jgi:hypothetical protein